MGSSACCCLALCVAGDLLSFWWVRGLCFLPPPDHHSASQDLVTKLKRYTYEFSDWTTACSIKRWKGSKVIDKEPVDTRNWCQNITPTFDQRRPPVTWQTGKPEPESQTLIPRSPPHWAHRQQNKPRPSFRVFWRPACWRMTLMEDPVHWKVTQAPQCDEVLARGCWSDGRLRRTRRGLMDENVPVDFITC